MDFLKNGLGATDKIVISTVDRAHAKGQTTPQGVNEKLWGKEVADAVRFAEQARNGQEMSRMADFRTTQVVTDKVSEDTQKIIYELEEAISDLTGQKQEGSSSRRTSPYKKATAHVVGSGPAEKTWFEQQHIINAIIENCGQWGLARRWQMAFVFHVASDETPGIARKRRAFGETDWTGARSSRWSWASGWWRGSWSADKNWLSWKDSQQRMETSSKNGQNCVAGWKGFWRQWKDYLLSRNWWTCGIVWGQEDGIRFCRKKRSATSKCGNQHIQFKTTQLLFEVVHDVEGGRTRAVWSTCWRKRNKAFGKETSLSTSRIVQVQKKSISVEGDADRFAWELLH